MPTRRAAGAAAAKTIGGDGAVRAILRTTDRSLIESVRLALEAEGIAAVFDQESGAIPFIPVAVFVTESDVDHALRVIQDLVP